MFIALIQKSDFLVSTSHSIINNNKISTDPEQAESTIPQNAVNLNANKKASLKNHELKANRNMTLMVICTSALYSIYFIFKYKSKLNFIAIINNFFYKVFGSLPRNTYIIVKYWLESSARFYYFSLFTFLILMFSHSINFVYLLFF